MTQSGFALKINNKKWEDYASLKKTISRLTYVREHRREFAQTTANAAASLENVSGETLAAMAASKTLNVWQKTDQVGTDGAETGKITWATVAGVKTDAIFTLNAVNTTTHVAAVAAVTTARYIESFEIDNLNCADEVLLGNVAGTEVFAVIPVGYHQCLKSGFMATAAHRSFIGRVQLHLSLETALVTLVCTFTPLGATQSTTKTFQSTSAFNTWEPCLELKPGTEVSWTIEDNNAAHPVANVDLIYVEAW